MNQMSVCLGLVLFEMCSVSLGQTWGRSLIKDCSRGSLADIAAGVWWTVDVMYKYLNIGTQTYHLHNNYITPSSYSTATLSIFTHTYVHNTHIRSSIQVIILPRNSHNPATLHHTRRSTDTASASDASMCKYVTLFHLCADTLDKDFF